jgi:hypothetical protein
MFSALSTGVVCFDQTASRKKNSLKHHRNGFEPR